VREPSFIIKIAADSIGELRASDVGRVLESASEDERGGVAAFITGARPELTGKVKVFLEALREESIISLLWGCLPLDPEFEDRRQTGWGTKTKAGLVACLDRIYR
jgi:hypothetical protein